MEHDNIRGYTMEILSLIHFVIDTLVRLIISPYNMVMIVASKYKLMSRSDKMKFAVVAIILSTLITVGTFFEAIAREGTFAFSAMGVLLVVAFGLVYKRESQTYDIDLSLYLMDMEATKNLIYEILDI